MLSFGAIFADSAASAETGGEIEQRSTSNLLDFVPSHADLILIDDISVD
jgi:hypothetical protein